MNRQRLGLWWFVGTLVAALLSMLVPLPDVLEPFKPYWPALVLLYWSLEAGDRVTLGLAFTMGLANLPGTRSISKVQCDLGGHSSLSQSEDR